MELLARAKEDEQIRADDSEDDSFQTYDSERQARAKARAERAKYEKSATAPDPMIHQESFAAPEQAAAARNTRDKTSKHGDGCRWKAPKRRSKSFRIISSSKNNKTTGQGCRKAEGKLECKSRHELKPEDSTTDQCQIDFGILMS